MQLHRPFTDFGRQPPGPFVGLVQIHVVQRYGNVQAADHLDLLVAGSLRCGPVLGRAHQLVVDQIRTGHLGRTCFGVFVADRCRHRLGCFGSQTSEVELVESQRSGGGGMHVDRLVEGPGRLELRMCLWLGQIQRLEHLGTLEIGLLLRFRGALVLPLGRRRLRWHRRDFWLDRCGRSGRRGRKFSDRLGHGRSCHADRSRAGFDRLGRAWNYQWKALAGQAQPVRRLAKWLSVPGRIGAVCNVFHPAPKTLHGLGRQAHQVGAGRLLLCQPGIEQLLHRPRRLAEFGQAHHPGTALERMEGAPQDRLLAQVGRFAQQRPRCGQTGLHHFARLLQEDVTQFGVVFIQRCGHSGAGCDRGRSRHRWCRRLRRNQRQLLRGRGRHGLRQGRDGGRQCRLHRRRERQLRRVRRCGHRELIHGDLFATHGRLELAELLVVDKELLGQRALVTQHVDQEPHGAQAVTQLLEDAGAGTADIDVVDQNLFDAVAHTQGGQRGLVHSQHREHTAHLGQLAGHLVQRHLVSRVAEELVERLLCLVQRGAQFLHHAAHGLAVADPAVQVLDPGLQHFGLATRANVRQALSQAGAAFGHVGFGGIEVVVSGFQVQHRGGHLHRDGGAGRLAAAHRRLDHPHQGSRQLCTFRVQFQDRFTDRVELLQRQFEPVGIAAGQGRPGLGGSGDTLARLGQHRRIEAAELRAVIVHMPRRAQAIGSAHRRQNRCVGWVRRHRVSAIEQVILGQSVGHGLFAMRQAGVLHQDARRGALYVQVGGAQPGGQCLEEGGADLPEDPRFQSRLGLGQSRADVTHHTGRGAVAGSHDPQHGLIDPGPKRRLVVRRSHGARQRGVDPAPLDRPEIGRMHPVAAGELEHVAVLRKQRHRRGLLALEHALEVLAQGKAGALDLVRRLVAAQLWPQHELLRQRLHRAQQLGRSTQADHLQRADRLVQLLPGDAQLAGVELGEV